MQGSDNLTSGWRVFVIRYAPLVLWIGLIFYLSSPEGSFSQTSRIIGPLLQFFFPDLAEETRQLIHGYVRKCAHFTAYAVLAFLAVRAFSISAMLRRKRFLWALVLVAAIALLDEFNQSFEASRTGSFWDVMLDIFGGLTAIAIVWFWTRRHTSPDTPG